MSQAATVNGDKPHSVTLDHITSYPLVADSIHFYQENPLGAKSISLAQSAYSTFAVPVLPYFQTPYSIISPYLSKADSFGNDALTRVDTHFPALKETDFNALKSNASAAAGYPFKVAGEGRDYVINTYEDEYNRSAANGQKGIVVTGRAVVSTEIRIAAETMRAIADWMGPRKEQAEEKLEKLKKIGNEKATKAKKTAHEKHEAVVNHH